MKLFLDTADINEISELNQTGLVDGITTNPSLIAKSGRNIIEAIEEICGIISGPVSAEVTATDYHGMMDEGKRLAKIASNITVKLPLTSDGLKACASLRSQNILVNVTLCFSTAQALLAAKAGASFISPFVGRLDDIGSDGMNLISEIAEVYSNYNYSTEILVASVRSVQHVVDAALVGADVATIPPKIMLQMYKHPLTDKGLADFLAFIKSKNSNQKGSGMSNDIIDEKLVSVFLDNNPDYLKTYLNAQIKIRSKEKSNQTAKFNNQKIDSNIIDVTGEIAKRAREEARILSEKNLSLIDDVKHNTKKWQRLLNVAIAFIRIRNLKQFSDIVDEKLPLILELAGARLLMPKEFAIKDAEEYGFLELPAKQIQKIKEASSVYLGPPPELGLTLFSNPKASIAVISLPENLPAQISGSVLLLAGRDKNSFQLGNTDEIFSNLSNII